MDSHGDDCGICTYIYHKFVNHSCTLGFQIPSEVWCFRYMFLWSTYILIFGVWKPRGIGKILPFVQPYGIRHLCVFFERHELKLLAKNPWVEIRPKPAGSPFSEMSPSWDGSPASQNFGMQDQDLRHVGMNVLDPGLVFITFPKACFFC